MLAGVYCALEPIGVFQIEVDAAKGKMIEGGGMGPRGRGDQRHCFLPLSEQHATIGLHGWIAEFRATWTQGQGESPSSPNGHVIRSRHSASKSVALATAPTTAANCQMLFQVIPLVHGCTEWQCHKCQCAYH